MKEIIEQLRTLNEIDNKIAMVRKDMERLPKELADRQSPIRLLKVQIEKTKAEVTQLKISADSAELDVKAGEDALKRLAMQMNVLKTSKEWDTIKRQMDAQRGWNKENEGKELALLEQIENKQAELDKHSASLQELESSASTESERVEKELQELGARLNELSAEREKLTPGIPDKELTIYTRIAGTRGVAISYVKNGNCSLCFMRLPPQIQNLALLGRDITCCPSCGRILTAAPK
ncbi:MAG TPA: C4-type zinc ribbon domain-containing protein [Planctomycetota bacterium]|nr:C4-type zinc ribbon domain-containing protein [Planctomycetota bacterium]